MALAVVSGAAGGFGSAVVLQLAKSALFREAPTAKFILLSRSLSGLEALKESVCKLLPTASVDLHAFDLSELPALPAKLAACLEKAAAQKWSRSVLISNAGTLGQLGFVKELSLDGISKAVSSDITASSLLISEFVRRFRDLSSKSFVVNISSLAAVEPFPGKAVYCSGKAARDMFIKVLAKEEKPDLVKALNYAPGPMSTKMMDVLIAEDPMLEYRKIFGEMKAESKLVDPFESAAKLVKLIENDAKWESGSHIDYYDE